MTTNTSASEQEKLPLDTRLLSDAIIELNIARRNVAIYPKGHPSVEKSLDRAFDFLNRLFELRPEITLAVAKDTLIIDDYYLDKKNPVYREFALQLSRLNIAYVTFIIGVTREELYTFHRFVSEKRDDMAADIVKESFQKLSIVHIRAGFIDYDAFVFKEDNTIKETNQMQLWERYVYGLMEGTLQTDIIPDDFKEIPPELLAQFINRTTDEPRKVQAYDSVITSYMRRATDRTFSGKDLKRLLEFINRLKPELKKKFLVTTTRHFTEDIDATYRSLQNTSIEQVMELLDKINEQQVFIPDSLKNVLDKLSELPSQDMSFNQHGDKLLIDDLFLSQDVMNLLRKNDDETLINEKYNSDIRKLLKFDMSKAKIVNLYDIAKDYTEEALEIQFNQTLLELIATDIITEEEYQLFADMIKDHIEQFIWTGQYRHILTIMRVIASHVEQNRFSHITLGMIERFHDPEFIAELIESFGLLGRQMREDVWILCEFYGEQIIPYLIAKLVKEESTAIRKFLIGLIKKYDDKVIPDVLKMLGDSRWFVKRNMLHILGELNREEVIPHVRPYCRHENPKVGIEAIRCLLSLGDLYGVDAVRELIRSESRDSILQAIMLSGIFRLNEVVPDLIQLLRKRDFSSADAFDKIQIVKALGAIGDPAALDELRTLLSCKSIFFKGIMEKLKEEVYRTLKYYPIKTVRDFVYEGLQSPNTYIREESNRLLKKSSQ